MTLPEEMLVEIFSRLPAKSARRLCCLSRSWAATLTSAPFVDLHLHQANSTPKLFLTTAHLDLDVDPDENSTWRVQVLTKPCRGLVLLLRPPQNGHYVFNPSTGELLRLLDREEEECQRRSSVTYGLGYTPATMEHKVVRIFSSHHDSLPCCEVFSLEASAHWRAVAQTPPSCCAVRAPAAVFCDGHLHFLLQQQGGTSSSIVTFDVGAETFGSLATPPSAQDALPPPLELTVLDGCLCVCVFRHLPWNGSGGHDPYCIWRLACREAGGRWEKLYRVMDTCPQADHLLRLHWFSPLEIYGAGNGRKKIVFATEEGVMAYDLDGGGDPEMLVSPVGDSSGGTAISSCTVGLLEESLVSVCRTRQGWSGRVRGLVQDIDGDSLTPENTYAIVSKRRIQYLNIPI